LFLLQMLLVEPHGLDDQFILLGAALTRKGVEFVKKIDWQCGGERSFVEIDLHISVVGAIAGVAGEFAHALQQRGALVFLDLLEQIVGPIDRWHRSMIPHEGSGRNAMSGPVTIADLMRDEKLLWVYCNDCCRERDVDPKSLALPADTSVPGLGRRYLKCSTCGSRNILTKPEIFPGGIAAARAKFR
jgi:hypothetical protein